MNVVKITIFVPIMEQIFIIANKCAITDLLGIIIIQKMRKRGEQNVRRRA